MTKNSTAKKIVGVLLLIAIIWFLFHHFRIQLNSENDTRISIGRFKSTMEINVRPLKTQLVSFTKSKDQYLEIEIQNIDTVPGNVTVFLQCPYLKDLESITLEIKPNKTKLFTFTNIQGDCSDYIIEPSTVKIEKIIE